MFVIALDVASDVNVFPESEWFREGEDVFVFLLPGETKGVFALSDGAFGAYRIADGKVTAMTKRTAMARHEQPETFTDFEKRVLDLIKR